MCRIITGGATEESAKANAALFGLFPIMVGAMLLLLMWQLRHFGRTALVLATAPLGIPGAAAALLVMDMPFGFVALLGVIALAGMIMRNTVILVDQVRQDLEAGADLRRAIVESTVRRARPVVLTALAAVLAFVPLTLSVFWGPMAVAMIGGLALGTFATLLVVPALYALALRRQRVPAAWGGRRGGVRSGRRYSPRAPHLFLGVRKAFQRVPGGKHRAFLPAGEPGKVFAGEVVRPLGRPQQRIHARRCALVHSAQAPRARGIRAQATETGAETSRA